MSKAAVVEPVNINNMKEEVTISPTVEKKQGAMGMFSRLLRLDSLGKRSASVDTSPPCIYYGVYIPCELKKGPDEEALHVYKNKSEALELIKRYKSARFKVFQNHQDAVSFALRGADVTDMSNGNDSSVVGEKPYPFKAPSPQDMVSLRKAIEAGLMTTVSDRIWDNPWYLVSSGNTPSILQEGSRYNALHIAARAKSAEMCNLILTTVGDPNFIQTLYGKDAKPECCKEFAGILVDRYLNTPDKPMNETPLHFASKLGAVAVVEVLTSFPQCNVNAVNKYGKQPRNIICERSSQSSKEDAATIARLLSSRYYVPVLHTEDDSLVPTIGEPFTTASRPEFNNDPLSPRYEIRAYAGPMPAQDADQFRRKWKTPPRGARPQPGQFRLKEVTKGLETVGRNLAEELHIDWKEYWPFLDTFTDFRTAEGLALLENYLKTKYDTACCHAYNESVADHTTDELSISKIGPAEENKSNISDLCAAFKTCTLNDRPHYKKTDPVRQRLCRQPVKQNSIQNGDPPQVNHTVIQLLCIERTCQVFANRIADTLIYSLSAEPFVAEQSLKAECKHLQHTIFTYMDDDRFKEIQFNLIHSRLAQLIVYNLKQRDINLSDINLLVEFLVKLRCPNDDIFSSDEERKPPKMTENHVIDCHVRCLSRFVSEDLAASDSSKGPSVSQNECKNIWEKASKCCCMWNVDFSTRNSKKNASFRKSRSLLSSSPKSESFVRKLTFDQDIGDGKVNAEIEALKEEVTSANTPVGDSIPQLFTVEMDKCEVVSSELISDDDSDKGEEEVQYFTASEHSDEEEMMDASDRTIVEAFIYGEEPSKMDRLVYEALTKVVDISPDEYPNICRWRHTVSLYSASERDKWITNPLCDDVTGSPVTYSFSLGHSLADSWQRRQRKGGIRPPDRCSTPKKTDTSLNDSGGRSLPYQVSNWLRVTGPNSPRSALVTKNIGHNASFGF